MALETTSKSRQKKAHWSKVAIILKKHLWAYMESNYQEHLLHSANTKTSVLGYTESPQLANTDRGLMSLKTMKVGSQTLAQEIKT